MPRCNLASTPLHASCLNNKISHSLFLTQAYLILNETKIFSWALHEDDKSAASRAANILQCSETIDHTEKHVERQEAAQNSKNSSQQPFLTAHVCNNEWRWSSLMDNPDPPPPSDPVILNVKQDNFTAHNTFCATLAHHIFIITLQRQAQ
jgi:hypothetical protein